MAINDVRIMNNVYCDARNLDAALAYLKTKHDHWSNMGRDDAIAEIAKIIQCRIVEPTKENLEKVNEQLMPLFREIFITIDKSNSQPTKGIIPPERFDFYFVTFYQRCG